MGLFCQRVGAQADVHAAEPEVRGSEQADPQDLTITPQDGCLRSSPTS